MRGVDHATVGQTSTTPWRSSEWTSPQAHLPSHRRSLDHRRRDDQPERRARNRPAATWRWLFADEAGVVVDGPDVAFDSQAGAEEWLRDEFEQLADDGIATVSLIDGEHSVYGPMFLGPDGTGPEAEAEI